jgi:4a-hydroxytetrahydrobiopterin dehydratase
MPRPEKLAEQEVRERVADLPEWTENEGKLHREYKFADFAQAFAFMTYAATVAEKMNHHPEWFNVYNRVTVDLSTHDAGGITMFDFELAAKMEKFASKLR